MPKPKTPLLTVDAVVFDGEGRLLLIRRGNPPFKGAYALPGGFVDIGETVEHACSRELREETGLVATKLTLVGVYSDPRRDPRFHTSSVVYLVKVRSTRAVAGDDAAAVEWISDWKRVPMAFDHYRIVKDAFRILRRK